MELHHLVLSSRQEHQYDQCSRYPSPCANLWLLGRQLSCRVQRLGAQKQLCPSHIAMNHYCCYTKIKPEMIPLVKLQINHNVRHYVGSENLSYFKLVSCRDHSLSKAKPQYLLPVCAIMRGQQVQNCFLINLRNGTKKNI